MLHKQIQILSEHVNRITVIICLIIFVLTASGTSARCAEESNKSTISAIVLSDYPTDGRTKLGYLVTDVSGKPAIYPSPRVNPKTKQSNELCNLSSAEIQRLWGSIANTKQPNGFDFVGWTGKWSTFHVELRFVSGRCSEFRVLGPYVVINDWLPTADILNGSVTGPTGKLVLSPWIGCVDGPRDVSHCGIEIP